MVLAGWLPAWAGAASEGAVLLLRPAGAEPPGTAEAAAGWSRTRACLAEGRTLGIKKEKINRAIKIK